MNRAEKIKHGIEEFQLACRDVREFFAELWQNVHKEAEAGHEGIFIDAFHIAESEADHKAKVIGVKIQYREMLMDIMRHPSSLPEYDAAFVAYRKLMDSNQ